MNNAPRVFAPLALASTLAVGAALAAGPPAPPKPGVYGCYGQFGPAFPVQFGRIDGESYSNYDGGHGRYVFADEVLTMTTGPMKGAKYRRAMTSPKDVFRMLDEKGALTAFNCPWIPTNAAKGLW